ncbi:MAG: rod-binding protein [Clostridiales bacterium]
MNIQSLNKGLVNNLIDSTKNLVKKNNFENNLKAAYDENDKKKLKESCQDFESIFLNIVYKEMKSTVPKSGLIENSQGKEIFESMLDDELMKGASKNNSIGLADQLYNSMVKKIDNFYVNTKK